jgi:hypothetical protein
MAYTTIEKIRKKLPNLDIPVSTINQYIEDAKDWIDNVTDTTFEHTELQTKIFTPKITSQSVSINYATEFSKLEVLVNRTEEGDTWLEVENTSYRVMPENSNPKMKITFLTNLAYPIYFEGVTSSLRVTARWGYSATAPVAIQRIATQYVVEQLKLDSYVEMRPMTEKLGDASVSYNFPSSVKTIERLEKELMRYKDWGDVMI